MDILKDVLLAIPIGACYNILIYKTGEVFNGDSLYKEKFQRNVLLTFGGGLLGSILAYSIFKHGEWKNRPIRYGLYLGSIFLFIDSIGYNWHILENDTKLIIMLLTLIALCFYTYTNSKQNKKRRHVSDYDGRTSTLPAVYAYRAPEGFDQNDNDIDEIMNY